jgi:hypothetical protein
MKKALVVIALVASSVALVAQDTKNPVSSTVKDIMARQQKNLTAAAEEMPADKYGFKPTDQQISFAHLMMHTTEANNVLCATISDSPAPKTEEVKETDGKDKLVAALKASFDFCNSALAKVDDSKLGDTVELFGGRKAPRAAAMFSLTGGWADHYGTAAIYLRLNGMLPPTAQPKK